MSILPTDKKPSKNRFSQTKITTYQDLITGNITLDEVNKIYHVDSSTNNNIEITLPSSANDGDIIKIHHEKFLNGASVVNIIDPAFADKCRLQNGDYQTIEWSYTVPSLPEKPHWIKIADVTDTSGGLSRAFKTQIAESVVAQSFYLSNQNLLGGKSLVANPASLTEGFVQGTSIGSGEKLETFYTPELNETKINAGQFNITLFGQTNSTDPQYNYFFTIDVYVTDSLGNKKGNFLIENRSPEKNEVLQNSISSLNFAFLVTDSIDIDLTDRIALEVRMNASASGGSIPSTQFTLNFSSSALSSIITTVEKKNDLNSGQIIVGDSNNKAQAVVMSGDATIDYTGKITLTNRDPIGKHISAYRNENTLSNGLYVKCWGTAGLAMSITGIYATTFQYFNNNNLTTTNLNEKGKFFVNGSTFYTPDLRGYFLRAIGGVDSDPNRTLGSIQNHQLAWHTHDHGDEHRSGTRSFDAGGDLFQPTANANTGYAFSTRTTSGTGGAETVPVNVGTNVYVKML